MPKHSTCSLRMVAIETVRLSFHGGGEVLALGVGEVHLGFRWAQDGDPIRQHSGSPAAFSCSK